MIEPSKIDATILKDLLVFVKDLLVFVKDPQSKVVPHKVVIKMVKMLDVAWQ